MRIFRNRGDIYFSKADKERSAEQHFLITSLVLIVVFTVGFISFLAVKNDFSIKEFFKPEDMEASQEYVEEDVILPAVSGKTNYVIMVSNEDELLFASLVQVDLDNIAYKCAMLSPDTVCDSNSLSQIYGRSGAENVKKAIESVTNIAFDHYIDISKNSFRELFNKMGVINYPVLDDIKFSNNSAELTYSLKLKAGEQKINGDTFVNLMRYYIETGRYSLADDLMLNSMLQHINSENYESREKLFSYFVTEANTDISVRNFSSAGDALTVLSNDRTGVKVYGVQAEYEKNVFTKKCIKSLKGYFAK